MRNRMFTPGVIDGGARSGRIWRLAGRPARWGAAWPHVRWERVRAIRAALRAGRYNLEARFEALLDDPPGDPEPVL